MWNNILNLIFKTNVSNKNKNARLISTCENLVHG